MARRKTDAHVQWTADGVCRYFRISWSKKFGDTFALILVPSYLVALICSSYRRLSKHTGSEPPFLHTLLYGIACLSRTLQFLLVFWPVAQHH